MRAPYGFTVIELLVVIAIVGLLATVAVSGFAGLRNYFTLRSVVQDVQTAIIDARSATLAAKNNTVHGVRIESGKVIRFQGPTYTAGAPTNVEFIFPSTVTAVVSLSGGGSEVVFTRLTGIPQKTGTIILTESRSLATTSLTITGAGLVEM